MATKDSRPVRPATARKRKTAKTNIDSTTTVSPTHEEIRTRAYFLYLQRNGSSGDPQDDWFRAEQELTAGVHGG